MIDSDLAELYQVETKRLKEQVKRNIERFPSDFMFELTEKEFTKLRSHFATTKFSMTRIVPMAFSEHGILMLSSVLRSDIAIDINIQIMRTFVELRKFALTNNQLAIKFNELEQRVLNGEKVDKQILDVLNVLMADGSSESCGKIGFIK